MSKDALQEVLHACSQQIPEELRMAMDVPISLHELQEATKQLAKNKMPGKDGVPMEFFLATWEHGGPILLEVLKRGLADGSLHPQLIEEIIALLPN